MADHYTTRLQIPYPDIDDPANVPADMQQLAERVDLLIPGSGAASALNRVTVGDVGMAGQIRAGRALALADFTALGLSAPAGLWNLSDLTDVSGNNRPLQNKGAVAFAPGINGVAATAAQFTGSAAQALYVNDIGVADSFRIRTGSFGCWFRTARRATAARLVTKMSTGPGQFCWALTVQTTNVMELAVYTDGTNGVASNGVSDVVDDRWHFVVGTTDGTAQRLYVDGVMEATAAVGLAFAGASPLNIGAAAADGATGGLYPHFGRIDEVFVTADVLSDDQIRALYCARLPHGYAVVPSGVKLNVTRRRRGGVLAVADFSTGPLRLHNFTSGAGLVDEGSNAQALTANGTPVRVSGADGASTGAYAYAGAQSLSATDAGLPAALTSRSYGCWFKTVTKSNISVMGWGTAGTNDARLVVDVNGLLYSYSGPDWTPGLFVADGLWHHVIVTEDNAAVDGLRRKLYLDSRFWSGSTVLTSLTLAGVGKFRIGSDQNGTGAFTGAIDGVFVCGYAMDASEIARLYAKGSQPLSPSPKNPGDHVEGWDAAAVYATFDTLDSTSQVDLGVAA